MREKDRKIGVARPYGKVSKLSTLTAAKVSALNYGPATLYESPER